jgi:chemotaxis protein CheY-P-specific phosphatase CheC
VKETLERVRSILEQGAQLSLGQLSKITGATWELGEIVVGQASDSALEALLDSTARDCYGSWIGMPQGAFLVMIPQGAGMRMTNLFTKDSAEKMDMLERREPKALAEICNIMVNGFVTQLADAVDKYIIVEAPVMMVDTERQLMVRALSEHAQDKIYSVSAVIRLVSQRLSSRVNVAVFLDEAILTQ